MCREFRYGVVDLLQMVRSLLDSFSIWQTLPDRPNLDYVPKP